MTRTNFFASFIGTCRLALAVVIMLTAAVMLALPNTFLNEARYLKIKQWWARCSLMALGISFDPSAHLVAESRPGGLVVSNHISFIDILLINAIAPSDFVSKSDVTHWPVIGWLATRVGTIFIERGNRRAAHRTQEVMVERLIAGRRVAIFPEGTTTSGKHLLPFHAALFQAAVDSAVAVHCLCISYHEGDGKPSQRPAFVGDLSLQDCMWQIVTGGPIVARVSWLVEMTPPHIDRRHLAHHAHQLMSHALAQLQIALR
jgi:1-acyl-sn-glycerol-3-phosphate acyltransferase